MQNSDTPLSGPRPVFFQNPENESNNQNIKDTLKNIAKAALAEFVSTFIFVFAGSGSLIAINRSTGDTAPTPAGLIASALAHAFALSAAVCVPGVFFNTPYTLCGHINPAVTLGAFIGGNIHVILLIIYWIAQLLGSIVACLLLMLVTGRQSVPTYGLSEGVGTENAVALEAVMTFGLVFTVYATMFDPNAKFETEYVRRHPVDPKEKTKTKQKKNGLDNIAPIAIGLIVGANILAGGAFDGAPMNPALAFGPALVNSRWGNHWVYWVGPLIGGGLAGFTYELAFINN